MADVTGAADGSAEEATVADHGATDAGAERNHQHGAVDAGPCTVSGLGKPGGVGVVDDLNGAAKPAGKQCVDVCVQPALVHIGGGMDHAVLDDARAGHTHR